ncbi:MAG: hypothetical protein LBV50_07520 [Novosphingobium sp.]|jgi:hypothetical protein|nr:hypothetical protein [Novosphingobium sp.]
MNLFLILPGLAAVGVLYAWYATIVAHRNKVAETLGGIDAQLQQHHDLIPNVFAIARRFYNSALGELRNAAQIFPGGLFAGLTGVRILPPFFEVEEESRKPVAAGDHLG